MPKTRGRAIVVDVVNINHEGQFHIEAELVLSSTIQRLERDLPVGVSVFDRREDRFKFHSGPLFANVILADEINRTTPRTQSALLEAMNEAQVTVDGRTMPLPQPFLVIATQNPVEHHGTYPLPESQLDRFLMRVKMGYPSHETERAILRSRAGGQILQ